MNKYQKALDTLKKTIFNLAPKHKKKVYELIYETNCLQELVDRATPKKPKITMIDKEYGSYQCDCPICGRFLSVNCKWDDTKFCPECGQAIDWSNVFNEDGTE